MKKTGFAFALLAILLMSCSQALAQKPAAKPASVAPTPDSSKLNNDKILQQVQTTKLQARQAALVPLFQRAQTLIQQLGILLNTGGNPAQVGVLVIQIHALQQQMGQAQQSFLTHFVAILDAEQLQKLQAVQIAAQLQPILPAFQPIFLF